MDIGVSIVEKTGGQDGSPPVVNTAVVSELQMSKCDNTFGIFPSFRANPRSACGTLPERVERTAILTGGEHLRWERATPASSAASLSLRGLRGSAAALLRCHTGSFTE